MGIKMKRMKNIFVAILFLYPFLFACGQSNDGKRAAVIQEVQTQSAGQPALTPVVETKTEPAASEDDIANSRRNAITRAVEKLKPAVVGINVTQIKEYVPRSLYDDSFFRFFFPNYRYQREVKSLGSGFIISKDGDIVTNEHVVQGAVKIVVSLSDGKEYDAELVGSDYITDVALLHIKGENLPYCELGNSDDVIIGEWAIALGNPFGLFEIGQQPSVTVGVVSAKNLDFGLQQDERLYQDMIQTDAAVNPGNSGGPMANALGQVIGMNTFIFTGSESSQGSIGLGFAIPINRVKKIVDQLIHYGKVDRQFWTGLEVETLTARVARYLRLRNVAGVIITNVEPNSPAENAGLEEYDIIIEINSKPISGTKDVWQVLNTLDVKAGDIISIKFIRKGKTYLTQLKLGKVK